MKEFKVPMRRCIGCMQSFEQKDLIRITYFDGKLAVDTDGRAKGRGVYLCRNEECIAKARKSRAFNRNYKTNIDNEIIEAVLEEVQHMI